MLLQEIFKDEHKEKTEIYGIDIDAESSKTEYSRPPHNFDMIGFNLKLGEDNLIDEELLDIIISYKTTNMNILIEVPSQWIKEEIITPKNLILLAGNVDFSLSLLPPGHPLVGDSITTEDYIEIIKSFNKAMMDKQNFDKFVAPISNFMEYLMIEKLLGAEHPSIKSFKPDNEYVRDTFSQYMSYEDSNAFKAVLREDLYAFYGGEEEFNIIANAIFQGILEKSKNVYQGFIEQHLYNQHLQREEQKKQEASQQNTETTQEITNTVTENEVIETGETTPSSETTETVKDNDSEKK